MGTTTTNYSFGLPTIDGDADSWGTQLNANWTKTDGLLSGSQDLSTLSVTTSVTLKGQGDLILADADSSHSVSLQAAATVGTSYTLTLPAADGSNGQVLATDGSGNLSFTTISGFDGAFSSLSGTPTTIAGYGITDAFDGAYASLTGTPTIPSNVSDLTNDSGFITSADGGNAATLDSIDSSQFLRSDADDTTTGNLTIQKDAPKLVLDSSSSGSNTNEQSATISLGESGTGGAALHLSYTGDGYSYIGMGALGSDNIPDNRAMRLFYTNDNVHFYDSLTCAGNITAYSSDRRLKENIETIENAVEMVGRLRGVTFDWKDGVEEFGFHPDMKHETGLIAQEVMEVIPDAVAPAPFDHNEQGSISGENYITVKPEKIIPVLIEAIKELNAEVEKLKAGR